MDPSFTITLLPISMERLKIKGGKKIKTMACSSLFLVNLRNSFLYIKSQSSELPGLGPGLSSLFQASPATGCFCGDSWGWGSTLCDWANLQGILMMVGLQRLTVDAQFSASGVRPPNWHFRQVSSDAQRTAWEPHFGHSIGELTCLWIFTNCLSLSLSYHDDISPQVYR